VDRWVEREIRGGCGFSSLMKQKKRENLLRNLHRRIFFLKFFCYEVIVKQIFKERPANYYSPLLAVSSPLPLPLLSPDV
jgi:hypothetical protein